MRADFVLRRWAARIVNGGIYLDAVDGHCADDDIDAKHAGQRRLLAHSHLQTPQYGHGQHHHNGVSEEFDNGDVETERSFRLRMRLP